MTQTMQTRRFPAALEHLLAVAREFLAKKTSIGKLRQAVREAEEAAPACDYCGRKPAFTVTWTDDDTWTHARLCKDCDDKETRTLKEDRAMSTQLHPNDVALNFENNNGDVTMMPNDPDIPDQFVARVDSEGDIHIEDDAPDFITHDFIMGWLIHTLSMTLELGDIDWDPDTCFMRAAGWDLDWAWDETNNTWVKEG